MAFSIFYDPSRSYLMNNFLATDFISTIFLILTFFFYKLLNIDLRTVPLLEFLSLISNYYSSNNNR